MELPLTPTWLPDNAATTGNTSPVIRFPAVAPQIGKFRANMIPLNAVQLNEIAETYFASDFRDKAAKTIIGNRYGIQLFTRWMHQVGETHISVASLTRYIDYMDSRLRRSTSAERWSQLCRFLSWMERTGVIETSPHHAIRNKTRDATDVRGRAMTHEEYLRLREVTTGHWADWIILLAWNTGMSLYDCCDLRWGNVDMDRCFIHIRRRKTGAESIIPFGPSEEIGIALKERRPPNPSPDDFVCHHAGIRLSDELASDRVRCLLDHMFKRAGLEGVTMHSMRRSYITMLANSGMNIALASKISGHMNPAVFASYVRPDPDALRQSVTEARIRAGMDRAVYVEPTGKRFRMDDCRTWKPNRVYEVKRSSITLPDGTPVPYVLSSANAEGKRALVTPCDASGRPVSNLQILAEFKDVRTLNRNNARKR